MSLRRGTVFLMAGWGTILATGYLMNLVLARWFPERTFGDYGTVMTVLLWFEILVITGLPVALQKFASASGEEAHRWLWTAVRIQAVVVAVLAAALAAAAPAVAALFRSPELAPQFRLAFMSMPFYGFFHLVTAFHNGRRRFGRQAACYAFYGAAKLVLVTGLCALNRSLSSALAGNLLASAAALGLAVMLLDDRRPHPALPAGPLVRFAVPSLLYSLMVHLLLSLDLWSVRVLRGGEASAYYFVAVSLARIPYFLLAGVSTVMLPAVSHGLAAGDIPRLRRTVQTGVRFALLLLVPVALLLTVYSRPVVAVLFSARYLPAAAPLRVLSWAMSGLALLSLLLTVVNASGRPVRSFVVAGLAVALDGALNLLLIPRYGLLGASLATGVSVSAAVAVAASDVMGRFHAWPAAKSVGRVCLASAGLLAPALLLQPSGWLFVPAAALSCVLYAAVLWFSGEIRPEDFRELTGRTGSGLLAPRAGEAS